MENNPLCSRRNFLIGASAMSFAGCVGGRVFEDRPNLKFGVVSDIHITDWASTEILRKTFRYYRDRGVDAVMIAGDMADHGLVPQLENVARAWFEVFPDDRGLGGKKVERLFIYGNHDPEGLAYRDAAMDKAFAVHHLTYEEAEKLTISRLGLAKAWERCFHEPYAPIYTKNVKGYDFIGGHWDPANGSGWGKGPAIDEWLERHASKIDTSKPFFYFQHPHPLSTVYADDTWGDDGGNSRVAFAPYANAVAFSGHSHRPITDPRTYWRGEFTSIGTGTLSYLCYPGKREGAKNYRTNLDGRCGQLVNVYDDHLVIERRDFFNDEQMDDDVTLEMPTKTDSFVVRGRRRSEAARFTIGAKPTVVAKTADSVTVSFPGAFANPTARPFDYKVWIDKKVGKDVKWSKIHLVAQPEACLSRRRAMAAGPVKFTIKGELPAGDGALRVNVIARNSYGIDTDKIVSDWL